MKNKPKNPRQVELAEAEVTKETGEFPEKY